MEELTIEDLVAIGYTLDEAEAIIGNKSKKGLQIPKIKFNYSDALAESGIPKGTFTSGFKDDKVNVTEQGIVYGSEGQIIVLDVVHQITHYDGNLGKVVFKTPLYRDVYTSEEQVCSLTGLTAPQYKEQGKKPDYFDIYLVLLKTPSMTSFEPVVLYLKGFARMHLKDTLKKLKISEPNMHMLFTFKNIKVATRHSPVWVMDVLGVTSRSFTDMASTVALTREPMRTFREWVDTASKQVYKAPVTPVEDDEEIPF